MLLASFVKYQTQESYPNTKNGSNYKNIPELYIQTNMSLWNPDNVNVNKHEVTNLDSPLTTLHYHINLQVVFYSTFSILSSYLEACLVPPIIWLVYSELMSQSFL